MSQLIDESAEDFIARVMKKAKYVPNIDESLLRSAVIQGLRPQIRSHVLQANIHNMADLLQAARVADVATTSSDPTFQQLLTEIRVPKVIERCPYWRTLHLMTPASTFPQGHKFALTPRHVLVSLQGRSMFIKCSVQFNYFILSKLASK